MTKEYGRVKTAFENSQRSRCRRTTKGAQRWQQKICCGNARCRGYSLETQTEAVRICRSGQAATQKTKCNSNETRSSFFLTHHTLKKKGPRGFAASPSSRLNQNCCLVQPRIKCLQEACRGFPGVLSCCTTCTTCLKDHLHSLLMHASHERHGLTFGCCGNYTMILRHHDLQAWLFKTMSCKEYQTLPMMQRGCQHRTKT